MYNPSCPVCSQEPSFEYCSCGLGDAKRNRVIESRISRDMLHFAGLIAVVLVPVVIFLSQYHGLGTDILTLKISAAAGLNSAESQQRLADLCERLERYDCSTSAYIQGTQKFSSNLDLWLAWAKMETRRKNLTGSLPAYAGYFNNGGKDNLVHYHYARALQDSNHIAEAIAEYQKMLEAEPEMLQVTVATTLVHLLIQEKRLDDALIAIEKFRQQGTNAKDYLNEELAQVQGLLKGKKGDA